MTVVWASTDGTGGIIRGTFAIARLYIGMLLLRHADVAVRSSESLGARALTVATRWCARELVPGLGRDAAHRAASATLLWEPVPTGRPDA